VGEEGPRVEQSVSLEALDRSGAERIPRESIVHRVLGHVDMHTRRRRAPRGDRGERGLRHREAGMQADDAPDSLVFGVCIEEAQVLRDAQFRALPTISVRHLVAQHARNPRGGQCLGQKVEAAIDAGWRRVVIEDRGAAPPHAIGCGQQGGQADRVPIEGPIEPPPQAIQDLRKIAHLDPWIETARQRRVEVMVQVHESGQDQTAAGVQVPRGRVGIANLRLRADCQDALAFPGDGTASDHSRILPPTDDVAVSEHR